MKVGKTTRVLTVYQWKPDPSKKGNVLVKFAMRYTHPLITKSRYKYLTGGENKGWYSTKATPTGKDSKGQDKLVISDIKNSQLITKVSKLLNAMIDETVLELTGEKPKEIEPSKTVLLKDIARPYDVNKELYGLAFKWWVKRVKPAKNTLYSRVSVYNQHIFPNFNENMSFKQFCMEQEKMQSIIDNATERISKNIHIYLKMIFDWAVEHGELTISQHPILNKKVKRKTFTSAEEQAKLREDISEKYLEVEEANQVFDIIEKWTKRHNHELVADVLRIIYLTGMRPSEALGLNEDILDFKNKLIKVHWQRASHNKSDKEMAEQRLTDEKERYRAILKTKESVRTIPMSPKVEEILLKYIERNRFQAKFNPTYRDMGYIFTRIYVKGKNQQGSPLYQSEISMFLRGGSSQSAKYNKKSGKPYADIDDLVDFGRPIHIVPHMFRHSFVSVMADKKVSLNVIREFVGHSEDSKEIEKIYLHVMQKGKHKIEQAMVDLAEIII